MGAARERERGQTNRFRVWEGISLVMETEGMSWSWRMEIGCEKGRRGENRQGVTILPSILSFSTWQRACWSHERHRPLPSPPTFGTLPERESQSHDVILHSKSAQGLTHSQVAQSTFTRSHATGKTFHSHCHFYLV